MTAPRSQLLYPFTSDEVLCSLFLLFGAEPSAAVQNLFRPQLEQRRTQRRLRDAHDIPRACRGGLGFDP